MSYTCNHGNHVSHMIYHIMTSKVEQLPIKESLKNEKWNMSYGQLNNFY